MTKDALFTRLKDVLVAEFDIDPNTIQPESELYAELDLDSIDAVDLLVKMKEHIPGRIEPSLFKNARTVQDVVDLLFPLIQAAAS